MYDFIIIGVLLVDGYQVDIVINNGKIVVVSVVIIEDKENQIKFQIYFVKKVLDLVGKYYFSVGWIDFYVYCYFVLFIYYDEVDLVGVGSGVIIVVDVGSIGVNDVDDFYCLICVVKIYVYVFLNIVKIGIVI